MSLVLLCDRPHVRTVDFRNSRFVVSKAIGLNVDGRHLEMGDDVPVGVLSEEALRQIYDTPLRLIETFEFAQQIPELHQAYLHRHQIDSMDSEEMEVGPVKGGDPTPVAVKQDPHSNKFKQQKKRGR